MNKYIIKSEKPKCKTCGKQLEEWNPFTNEHEHIECSSERIVNSMMEKVKQDLNK